MNENNPLNAVQAELRAAIDLLGLPEDVYEHLKEPRRVIKLSIPIRLDNGHTRTFTGYRAQHIDVLGPAKGGVRFHPEVYEDEVKALSMWMSVKTAVLGLPYGGAKGAVVVEPKSLSRRELEALSRAYIAGLLPVLGPEKDIPAPDVNTNPEIMGWMLDEYDRLVGYHSPGFITGKPIVLGGSLGRLEATGRGVVITILEASRRLGLADHGLTAAIQGFGNVGSITARFLYRDGVKVVAVADSKGVVHLPEGLDIPALIAYRETHGTVVGFPGSNVLPPEAIFYLPVDILVPAALEDQITRDVARKVKASIVAEAANGPTTRDADDILLEKGVLVIPDILCNAGGVTGSYFEWVQNLSGYYWTEEEVNDRLDRRMRLSFDEVYQQHVEHKVSMRRAAYLVGVGRIANAMRARGWIS